MEWEFFLIEPFPDHCLFFLLFTPILLKLNSCLYHAFKICMWFGYNLKVNGKRETCVRNSIYSYISILFKLYRCLYNAFKLCMLFGYNPQINFHTFFAL